MSTTIFDAAFFSGMQLDAWTPHFYYISRYPEGREATISWPNLHNKFTNTTDGGVLIQVAVTDSSITVHLLGHQEVRRHGHQERALRHRAAEEVP